MAMLLRQKAIFLLGLFGLAASSFIVCAGKKERRVAAGTQGHEADTFARVRAVEKAVDSLSESRERQFAETVVVAIVPPLDSRSVGWEEGMDPRPSPVGFSADARLFVFCPPQGNADFKSCELIDVKTSRSFYLRSSDDGIEWSESAEKRLNDSLMRLGVSYEYQCRWPYGDYAFRWRYIDDSVAGCRILHIDLMHVPSNAAAALFSRSVCNDSGAIFMGGVYVSPGAEHYAILYGIHWMDDLWEWKAVIGNIAQAVSSIRFTQIGKGR